MAKESKRWAKRPPVERISMALYYLDYLIKKGMPVKKIEYDPEPKCEDCGVKKDVSWGADPYNAEINGDDTPVWMCGACREQSARDV